MSREPEKKSSATAKTGLGLAIGALSLAAANSGILGGGYGGRGCNGGSGGILGNLFGNNCGACAVYDQQKMDIGQMATTEVNMVDKYIMPMMHHISNLETKTAVNEERDRKNEVINGLLFKLADQKAENLFEKSQCCCEKNTIALTNAYNQLAAADKYNFDILANKSQCNYDRLSAQDTCDYEKVMAALKCCCDALSVTDANNYRSLDDKIACSARESTMRTDAEFALQTAQRNAQLSEAMRDVIKGTPYLSPNQLADPYRAGTNVIVSRQYSPWGTTWSGVSPVGTYGNYGTCGCNTGCGCNNTWAW